MYCYVIIIFSPSKPRYMGNKRGCQKNQYNGVLYNYTTFWVVLLFKKIKGIKSVFVYFNFIQNSTLCTVYLYVTVQIINIMQSVFVHQCGLLYIRQREASLLGSKNISPISRIQLYQYVYIRNDCMRFEKPQILFRRSILCTQHCTYDNEYSTRLANIKIIFSSTKVKVEIKINFR